MGRDYQTFNRGMSQSQIRAAALQTHTDAAKRIDNIHAVPPLYVQRRASSITIGMHKQHERRVQAGGGIPLVAFVLQQGGVYADSIRCRSRNDPGESVDILKEEMIGQSVIGTTVERSGVEVSFQEASDARNQRIIASSLTGNGAELETWNVLPSWEWGDVIWAAPIAEADRITLTSSASDDTVRDGDGVLRTGASGTITPKWIEVRGRWWAAERVIE